MYVTIDKTHSILVKLDYDGALLKCCRIALKLNVYLVHTEMFIILSVHVSVSVILLKLLRAIMTLHWTAVVKCGPESHKWEVGVRVRMHVISKQACNCSTLLLLSAVINPAEIVFAAELRLLTATWDG